MGDCLLGLVLLESSEFYPESPKYYSDLLEFRLKLYPEFLEFYPEQDGTNINGQISFYKISHISIPVHSRKKMYLFWVISLKFL